MAKLKHIATAFANRNILRIGRGNQQILIKPNDQIQIVGRDGYEISMNVLAIYDDEIILRASKGPSKIESQINQWLTVKRALWAAGIFSLFRSKK